MTRSYVSMMRKGKISNPGFDKLRAIAKAMTFPARIVVRGGRWDRERYPRRTTGQRAGNRRRLNHLFEAIKNERTGEPYTNAGEVVCMSLGNLTEEEVGGIRAGKLENPTISQVLALAEAFGVHPSYFLERSKEPTLLGEREINALGDRRARAILNRSLDLSDREKDMCWT